MVRAPLGQDGGMGTDEELVEAAKRGDRAALDRLFQRHQATIYRIGLRICGTEEDAKDVLQETLLAAVRALPEFRGASSVSTWLYTIARSHCLRQRRRSKYAPAAIESLDAVEHADRVIDPSRPPDQELDGRRLEAVLEGAIRALDPKYREVLVLRDVEGLSAAEVAEVLGLSVEAVKSRLHRARLAVRGHVAPALGPDTASLDSPGCRAVMNAFSRQLDGELDPTRCAELASRLADCPACPGRCDSFRAMLVLCRKAGTAPVPREVEESVRAAVRRVLDQQRGASAAPGPSTGPAPYGASLKVVNVPSSPVACPCAMHGGARAR